MSWCLDHVHFSIPEKLSVEASATLIVMTMESVNEIAASSPEMLTPVFYLQ
jgi:hypothetical protein